MCRQSECGSRRQAKKSTIVAGDLVLVKNEKTNKLSPNFRPVAKVITQKEQGNMTVRDDQRKESTRNSSFFKPYLNPYEPSLKTVNKNTQARPDSNSSSPGRSGNDITSALQSPIRPVTPKILDHPNVLMIITGDLASFNADVFLQCFYDTVLFGAAL